MSVVISSDRRGGSGVRRERFGLVGSLVSVVALLVMGVGAVGFVTASVVHDEVLKPDLYADAFAENEVYRRVYSDVLTDPAVRSVTDGLLGGFDFGGRDLADTTALSNALVRLAFPPDVLREVVDEILANVLAYLRGDSARLDTQVTLVGALERLDEAAAVAVRNVLAGAATQVLLNLDRYEASVRKFAEELAAGRIPTSVPVVGGNEVSEAEIIAAIDEATRFGLPVAVRDQVMAAVRSGEDRDALITAAATLTRSHLTALSAALATDGGLQLDYLDALGTRAGNPQHDTVARLNSIRDAIGWFPSWSRYVGAGMVAAGALTLLFVFRARLKRATAGAGCGFIVVGSVTWALWRLMSNRFGSPLVSAATANGSSALPGSVKRILGDVDASLGVTLDNAVDRHVSMLLVAGVIAVGAAAVMMLLGWFRGERRRLAAAATSAIVVLVGGVVWLLPDVAAPSAARECNGHRELCDRRYDEVVQAATHNSMSSPDVVRIWPEHDGNIRAQLDFGVRALMIDSKYWTGIDTPAELSTLDQLLPADIATSLFTALGSRTEARPGTFLCHSRCAYGAIPFADSLATVKAFLDDNPDEVVTLIIQDDVTRTDTEAAFEISGVTEYVYEGDTSDGWPTLGELIDGDDRLVVFAENSGPPPEWYRPAFEVMQETPFRVASSDEFTCTPNRGPATGTLFLLNHWVQREAPDRADAIRVNNEAFIVERARRCELERGQLPDLIAVNFFSIGDVIGAVDTLNGL